MTVLSFNSSVRILELLNSMQPRASKLRTGGTVLDWSSLLVVERRYLRSRFPGLGEREIPRAMKVKYRAALIEIREIACKQKVHLGLLEDDWSLNCSVKLQEALGNQRVQ